MKGFHQSCSRRASTWFIIASLWPFAIPTLCWSEETRRIAVLSPFAGSQTDEFLDSVRENIGRHGLVQGVNLALDYRAAPGASERLLQLARDLVRANPEVIVTTTTSGLHAAQQATKTIPIVVAGVDDAVQQGFVSSLARPGGNITGISWLNTELAGKRLQLLRDCLRDGLTLGVLREGIGGITQLRATEAAAQELGMSLRIMEVFDRTWLPDTFREMRANRVNAGLVADSPIFSAEREQVARLGIEHGIALMFSDSGYVRAGGLMSYGPKLDEVYARAAAFVISILHGDKPTDLPVEQPTKVELVINLRTAKALSMAIPPAVLVRADEVIE
jgi:ABC-type uncharacterized transport system substrate-binding protein